MLRVFTTVALCLMWLALSMFACFAMLVQPEHVFAWAGVSLASLFTMVITPNVMYMMWHDPILRRGVSTR